MGRRKEGVEFIDIELEFCFIVNSIQTFSFSHRPSLSEIKAMLKKRSAHNRRGSAINIINFNARKTQNKYYFIPTSIKIIKKLKSLDVFAIKVQSEFPCTKYTLNIAPETF